MKRQRQRWMHTNLKQLLSSRILKYKKTVPVAVFFCVSMRHMRQCLSFLRRYPWMTAILIGLLYFLVQLTQISQYGASWDEPLHRNWGLLFWHYWTTGDYSAITLMPGKGMFYGPLYYAINYALSEWLYGEGWMRVVAANHVLNLITTSIGVGLFFLVARRVVSDQRSALLAALFFALYPQLIAHAHYNPKDIPLMVALLASSLFFVRGLQNESRREFLIAAFLFGIAYALKVSAMLMAPVYLLSYLVWLHRRRGLLIGLREQWKTMFLGLVTFFVSSYLFWPSAWTHPSLLFQSLSLFTGADFWPGKVLYFGVEYAGKDLPFTYIVTEFAMATPVLLLLFFFVGFIVACRSLRTSSGSVWFFILLWGLLPLLVSMKPGLVRYDGIRQFFFALPALLLIASLGFSSLLERLQRRSRFRHAGTIFTVLVLASLVHQVALVHPYEGSYRNEVVQAMYPEGMDHALEVEYWAAPYKQGLEWLVEYAEPNPEICVPIAGLLVTWYPWREDFSFQCSPNSDYVMFITRYSEESEKAWSAQQPVFQIERMGASLLEIYRVAR